MARVAPFLKLIKFLVIVPVVPPGPSGPKALSGKYVPSLLLPSVGHESCIATKLWPVTIQSTLQSGRLFEIHNYYRNMVVIALQGTTTPQKQV